MMPNEASHFGAHSTPCAGALEGGFASVEPEPTHSQWPGDLDYSTPAWESAWIDLGGEG